MTDRRPNCSRDACPRKADSRLPDGTLLCARHAREWLADRKKEQA